MTAAPSRLRPLRSVGASTSWVAGLALALFALPVVALLARAIGDGIVLGRIALAPVLEALALSLVTTTGSLVVTIVLGLPLALVLARRRIRAVSVIETLVDLPIVLPPAVAGLALLLLLGRRGLLGAPLDALGVEIPFTTLAVVIAQTFVAAPFFIRAARAGFVAVDRDLEDAARADGASEGEVFRFVTLPLAGSSIAAGLVMTWARSLGEFGATIMFAGSIAGRTETLPLFVYGEFQGGDLEASVAAAAILVLAAIGVLVAVRQLGWGRTMDAAAIG